MTDTATTRRIGYPIGYGAWTLRRRARSHLLATGALALAVAFVVALGAVATLSESQILSRGLRGVDPGRRNVQLGHFGVPPVGGGVSSVEQTARRILGGVTGRAPVRVVQHLRHRRDAVRRAGGVRDDVVLLGVVLVVVDADADRHVGAIGRRGDCLLYTSDAADD